MATAAELMNADHWAQQVVSPVLFSSSLEVALASRAPMVSVVLEVGPNPVLARMAQSWIKPQQPLVWLASLDRQAGLQDETAVARAARSLEQLNEELDSGVFPNRRPFPWQAPPHPLLQKSLDFGDHGVEHTAVFHDSLMALFHDHTIQSRTLFPGAGFVEMALAAAALKLRCQETARQGVVLRDVSFLEPLDLEVGTALLCKVDGGGNIQFCPVKQTRVVCEVDQALAVEVSQVKDDLLSVAMARCVDEVTGVAERYKDLQERGFHGPQFQTLVQVWRGKSEFVARLRLPGHEENERYHVHPAVLDGMFQLGGFVDGAAKAWVPAAIERLELRLRPPDAFPPTNRDAGFVWATGNVTETNDRFRMLDLVMHDPTSGDVVMSVEGFRFMPLKSQPPASGLYEVRWVEAKMAAKADPTTLDEVLQLSLLALPGCGNLSPGVTESLTAAGLPSVVVEIHAQTPTTAEQWAGKDTLIVPVLRATSTAVMLTKLLNLLQVPCN